MKNAFYVFITAAIFSCNLSGKEKIIRDDSLEYYPPTPAEIPKQEFRHYYKRVVKHFDSLLLSKGFNGQLLVAKNGVVIFEKAMGYADLRTKDSLTTESPLHIASTTKTFTAMAILFLSEKKKLRLSDSLETYFPGFPYKGINIQMLLSHRSGIPNYLNYLSALKKWDTCYSNADVLNSLYSLQPKVEHLPGTRFSYSNTNYVLLALIIEKISGESYPAYMKRVFFEPLQMKNSFVYTKDDSVSATPSFDGYGKYWKPDPFDCTYGDKNIYTTANDMLKWDIALNSGQLFRKELMDSALAPLSNERPSVHNYGLGWRMLNLASGKKIIYHNGRWHGTNSVFAMLPDEQATIIVIGNKYNWRIYNSAMQSYNIFGDYFPGMNQQPVDEDVDEKPSETSKKTDPGPKSLKTKK